MPSPLAAALRLPAVPAPLPPTDAVALPVALVLVARVAGGDGALCRDNVEELRVGRPAAGRGVDDRDLARRSVAVSVAGTSAVKVGPARPSRQWTGRRWW